MPLASMMEVLALAERAGAAAGAFNMHTPEGAQGIVAAAERHGCPVILQVNEGTIEYLGLRLAGAMALAVAGEAKVPVAVHLDHGTSVELALACLEAGFNSVMYDGSHLSLAENTAGTRRVVEAAGRYGAAVEAELGRVAGAEEDPVSGDGEGEALTDLGEARDFVAATGIDSLAVAVGTAHGVYKGVPRLDYARLAAIGEHVSVPLVLHGASGLTGEQLRRAIAAGARKINFSTDLKQAFIAKVREELAARRAEYDPRRLFAPAREAVASVVSAKLAVLWPCH